MSDKLGKQIDVEREQINRLIDEHRSLLEKAASENPTTIEVSALASLLHSFYSGIENVFKRIATEIDGELPAGPAWHRQLLDVMASTNRMRVAVISKDLYDTLSQYLAFRHFFRQAYSFHFQWEKMSELVLNCESTMQRFEQEIGAFLKTTEPS